MDTPGHREIDNWPHSSNREKLWRLYHRMLDPGVIQRDGDLPLAPDHLFHHSAGANGPHDIPPNLRRRQSLYRID